MLDIDELIACSHDDTTLLHEVDDGDEVLQVRERDGLRWVHAGGRALLSAFRPDAPAELVFPNHRLMLCALLLCEQPGSVLNLGFGLGSFERYFRERLPETTVVSVDSSAVLVKVAREWFQIPADWPVLVETAHEHLRGSRRKNDLILCDIFSGDAHAPCLYDPDFHAAAAQRLNGKGVLALNLSPVSEDDLLEILVAVRGSFASVLLSTVSNHGNVVLLASREAPAEDVELLRRARQRRDALGMDLGACMGQFTRLPPRGGD